MFLVPQEIASISEGEMSCQDELEKTVKHISQEFPVSVSLRKVDTGSLVRVNEGNYVAAPNLGGAGRVAHT